MATTSSRDPVPDTDPTTFEPDPAGLETPVLAAPEAAPGPPGAPGAGTQAPSGATGPGHAATGGS